MTRLCFYLHHTACFSFVAEPARLKILAQFGKEIAVEYDRYARQQGCVDRMFLKKAVDVRAVAAQFPGKPGDGAFLALEFFLDDCSDGFHRLWGRV